MMMDERIERARSGPDGWRAPGPDAVAVARQTSSRADANSEDGRIRVTAAAGRLTGIELDGLLLRGSQADLEDRLNKLVNTALARSRPKPETGRHALPLTLDVQRVRLDTADNPAERTSSEAWTSDHRVYALASISGHIARIWWEHDAGGAEITGGLVRAVNNALAEAENRARRATARARN
ncbi:hypothetical protein EBO15_17365 [Actinomadura harenae]|uniref:Uncharacterized protein n=2 Tax=Actinomadura harenae TaxID=2483351 RepID=A0A3M2M0R2_9ACTN|nr:hypothetical protein EBO15_17365 [Actinomadura harenae]